MDVVSNIRQQVLNISILIVIFGIVSTDSYYSLFGLRYQDIGLPYDHLVYRGFLLPLKKPLFLLLYFFIFIATAYANSSFTIRLGALLFDKTATFVVVSVICLVVGFKLARNAGADFAISDVYARTTALRQLIKFHSTNPEKNSLVNGMLNDEGGSLNEKTPIIVVLRTSDSLVLVRQPSIETTRPGFAVFHIGIGSDDFYADQVPIR